ncbi:hypothetical protein HKX48_004091 [Thoreauomyces humboldtii]|nr:hypothetical protein HKX48_004091 [Thoreauomyces humboldtii]
MKAAFLLGSLTLALPAFARSAAGAGEDPNAGKVPANLITPSGPVVDAASYVAPATAKYDYADVLHKSFLFYWAQRSGKMPYQRLAWRSDSFVNATGNYGEDLSGGWFEAANTMKWGGPLAFTATQLAWNVYEFGDAMNSVGERDEALDWVQHGAEFLLNTYTTDGTTERLMGLYGDSAVQTPGGTGATQLTDVDFGYYGPPEEYMEWVPFGKPPTAYYCEGSATLKKGCSDIAGDYASALASASIVLRARDPAFADKCLAMAETIFAFATNYLGSYDDPAFATEQGWLNYKEWYRSYGYQDEMALASTWIYMASKNETYLTTAQTHLTATETFVEYSWSDKGIAAAILLNKLKPTADLQATISTFFSAWLPGGTIPYTPRGLVYYDKWGSLSYATNVGFIALVHAKTITTANSTRLVNFAVQQMNYVLGDCGRSWVVGFGTNSPLLPYHKSSYNSYIDYPMRGQSQDAVGDDFLNSATANRQVLYGALVGGPLNTDQYVDNRHDYTFTEVTQDYNAAFSGLAAGLIDHYGAANFKAASDCGLDLGWGNPNATKSLPVYQKGDCYHTCDPCSKLANSTSSPAPGASNSPVAGTATNPHQSGATMAVRSAFLPAVVAIATWFLVA